MQQNAYTARKLSIGFMFYVLCFQLAMIGHLIAIKIWNWYVSKQPLVSMEGSHTYNLQL